MKLNPLNWFRDTEPTDSTDERPPKPDSETHHTEATYTPTTYKLTYRDGSTEELTAYSMEVAADAYTFKTDVVASIDSYRRNRLGLELDESATVPTEVVARPPEEIDSGESETWRVEWRTEYAWEFDAQLREKEWREQFVNGSVEVFEVDGDAE